VAVQHLGTEDALIQNVQLEEEDWQKVMAVLATAPWNVANPLLMKMGDQLRTQAAGNQAKQSGKITQYPRGHPVKGDLGTIPE
jgi:hypothetical protein